MLSFSIWKSLHRKCSVQIQNKTTPPPPNCNMTSINDLMKFSFAEITQGQYNLVHMVNDGFLAIDLTTVLTQKNRGDASRALRDIPGRVFAASRFSEVSLAGKG